MGIPLELRTAMTVFQSRFSYLRAAVLCAFLGEQFTSFSVPLLVFAHSGSYSDSGLAYGLAWLPRVLLLPFSGYWVDRYGSKPILIFANWINGLSCIAIFLFLISYNGNLITTVLGLFSAAISLGTGQTILAAETTVAKCLSGDPQAVEQARLFRLDQLSMFCGPIIAGVMSIFLNIRIFFVVSSVLYIAGIIFLNRSELIKKNEFSPHQTNQKPVKKILKGFAIIFKNPILILCSVMAIGNNLISSVIEIISAGVITSKFEGTPQTFAIFNAGAGLAGFLALSLLPILIQRYDRKKIFLFSILLLLISTVFIATGKQVLNFIFSYSVIISSILVIGNYIRTKRGDIIPVEDLGTTVSVITMINQLTVPITGFLFAFLSSNTASYNWIWVVAIIQLAVGCAVLWTERKTEVK